MSGEWDVLGPTILVVGLKWYDQGHSADMIGVVRLTRDDVYDGVDMIRQRGYKSAWMDSHAE